MMPAIQAGYNETKKYIVGEKSENSVRCFGKSHSQNSMAYIDAIALFHFVLHCC